MPKEPIRFAAFAKCCALVGFLLGAFFLGIAAIFFASPYTTGAPAPFPTALLFAWLGLTFLAGAEVSRRQEPVGPWLLVVSFGFAHLIWGGPSGLYRPFYYLAAVTLAAGAYAAVQIWERTSRAERVPLFEAPVSRLAAAALLVLCAGYLEHRHLTNEGKIGNTVLLVGEEIPSGLKERLHESAAIDGDDEIKCFYGAKPSEEGIVFSDKKIVEYMTLDNVIERKEISWKEAAETLVVPSPDDSTFKVGISDGAGKRLAFSIPTSTPVEKSTDYHNLARYCMSGRTTAR